LGQLKCLKLACCPNLKRLPIGTGSAPMLREVNVGDEKMRNGSKDWNRKMQASHLVSMLV